MQCGGRFTTFERVQLRDLIVVKRDNRRAPFDRDKLRRSVSIALQKRPVSEEKLDQMISGIVRRLENMGESEIQTSTIGEMVMESLSGLDPVAFIRYASVYKDFKSPADFAAFVAKQTEDEGGGEKE
jgi:transcriptional repressor NrdR